MERLGRRKALVLLISTLGFTTGCRRHNTEAARLACEKIEADLHHNNLASAEEAARAGVTTWCATQTSDECVRFRILLSEALLDNSRGHEAYQVLQSIRQASPELLLSRDVDLARALRQLSRHSEALARIDSVLSRPQVSAFPLPYLRALNLKGLFLDREGDRPGAEAAWQKALTIASDNGDLYDSSGIQINLGLHYVTTGRPDRAVPFLENAISGFRRLGSPKGESSAMNNLAICWQELGDLDRSLEMHREAIAMQERMGANVVLIYSYGEAGRLYYGKGDLQLAIQYFKRALAKAQQTGSPSEGAIPAVNLASTYIALHDWDNAEKYNRQARTLSSAKRDLVYITANDAAIAAGRGMRDQAEAKFREVLASKDAIPEDLWTVHDELAEMDLKSGDSARAFAHFRSAVTLIEQTRAGLSQQEDQITFLFEPIHVYKDYVDALVSHGNWAKALLVADSSRAQVLLNRLDPTRPGVPAGTLAGFQAVARDAHATLIEYWLGANGSYAWIITPQRARMIQLPEKAEQIKQWVIAYRAEIERGVRDPLKDSASAGWKLYNALLQPLEPWLPANSRVFIVPDGPLNNLNFETLPIPSAMPCYWIEKATVSVAPSLGVLASKQDRGSSSAGGLLAVGDPEPVSGYPKLSYAAREILSLKERFPRENQTVLTGAQATPTAYLEAHPERFAYIHFTAHAEANGQRPLDSAVILSAPHSPAGDYKLYARQVSASPAPLRADLVTVSACRGAGSKAYSGEGLVGFAWAFLHAGARHVIAGLWDVDDNATAGLMDRLYADIAHEVPLDQALREAKLALLSAPGNTRKPYYWGPLQLYRRSVW